MPTSLIWRWQCCLQSCLKVTDILSYKDKHADRIIQLNCNRKSATPFLAEDYANKLLPTGLCGIPPHPYPSLPCTAVGPLNEIGRPMSSLNVHMWLGAFMWTRQRCKLVFFHLVFAPRRVSPLSDFKPFPSCCGCPLSEDMQTRLCRQSVVAVSEGTDCRKWQKIGIGLESFLLINSDAYICCVHGWKKRKKKKSVQKAVWVFIV